MDNSKSFVDNDFLPIKWKYELTVFKLTMFKLAVFKLTMFKLAMFKLTVHFKHEMIGKHFTETSNKVELRINNVQINHAF